MLQHRLPRTSVGLKPFIQEQKTGHCSVSPRGSRYASDISHQPALIVSLDATSLGEPADLPVATGASSRDGPEHRGATSAAHLVASIFNFNEQVRVRKGGRHCQYLFVAASRMDQIPTKSFWRERNAGGDKRTVQIAVLPTRAARHFMRKDSFDLIDDLRQIMRLHSAVRVECHAGCVYSLLDHTESLL